MSSGVVVCNMCKREVHQDGPGATWRHCEDKSPRCAGASSVHPSSPDEIVGSWCGADGAPEKTTTRRVAMPAGSLAALAAVAAMTPQRFPITRRPSFQTGHHGVDPQDVADLQRERLKHDHQPHQGKREKARRRRQAKRNAANAAVRAARTQQL